MEYTTPPGPPNHPLLPQDPPLPPESPSQPPSPLPQPPLSPGAPTGFDWGGRFAGTGEVDLGGWLSRGWQTIKDDLLTFAVASLLASLVGGATCGILAPALVNCGIPMMVMRKIMYGRVEIVNVFDGTKRFAPAILTALLLLIPGVFMAAISSGPQIAMGILAPDNVAAVIAANLWNMASQFVFSALLYGAIFFAFTHIAARNVGPIEALQASFDVFRRNVVMFALLALVYQLIAGLGVVACCVGVFLTTPLVSAAAVHAYIDHFGLHGVNIER